jgi:hypothetical protein
MDRIKNIEEAFSLNWQMRGKNSLYLGGYRLENFLNLIEHGWTMEDIGKAFMSSLNPEKNIAAQVEQIMEEKGYSEFKKAVENLEKIENEIAGKIETIIDEKEGRKPITDGIINIEYYLRAKYKILWILREPVDKWRKNRKGQIQNGGLNLVREIYAPMKINEINKKLVARRVMKATYKILPKSHNALRAFKSIAYINIKKIPGLSKGHNPKEIQQAYDDYNELLKYQIETYAPDIVICGNTLQYFSDENYFIKQNRVELFSTPKGQICYYKLKERLYINIYHPAVRDKNDWEKCVDGIVKAVSDWEIGRKNIRNNNVRPHFT